MRDEPSAPSYRVRRAREDDLCLLPAVERAAATRFRSSRHPEAEALPLVPVEAHRELARHHGVWVAVDAVDAVVGFVAWTEVDGQAYVVELDVHPEHAGARLGQRLLEAVAEHARERGYRRMLLRTFADVPWNAPYYRRLGFRDERELGPGILSIALREREIGIDLTARVTLARELEP